MLKNKIAIDKVKFIFPIFWFLMNRRRCVWQSLPPKGRIVVTNVVKMKIKIRPSIQYFARRRPFGRPII